MRVGSFIFAKEEIIAASVIEAQLSSARVEKELWPYWRPLIRSLWAGGENQRQGAGSGPGSR